MRALLVLLALAVSAPSAAQPSGTCDVLDFGAGEARPSMGGMFKVHVQAKTDNADIGRQLYIDVTIFFEYQNSYTGETEETSTTLMLTGRGYAGNNFVKLSGNGMSHLGSVSKLLDIRIDRIACFLDPAFGG